MSKQNEDLREELAAIEHERWSHWQKWMYSVLAKSGEMTEGIDEIMQRWNKQADTPYSQLSEREKASDMEQVDRYWPLIDHHISKAVIEELETWISDKCICNETDTASCDSLWHHDNEIKSRIAELKAKQELSQ